jgi:hypothetical protein
MELWRDWVNDWELKSQTRGGNFARKSLGNVTQVIFHTRFFASKQRTRYDVRSHAKNRVFQLDESHL